MERKSLPAALSLPLSLAVHRSTRRWNGDNTVTFLFALAASGTVTFAAASAGVSRRSAYALKRRDAGFARLGDQALAGAQAARLWDQALAGAQAARAVADRELRGKAAEGNEVDEVEDSPIPLSEGDNVGNTGGPPGGALTGNPGRRSRSFANGPSATLPSAALPSAALPGPRLGARLARTGRGAATFQIRR